MTKPSRIPSTVGDNNIRYRKLAGCRLRASAWCVGPMAGGSSISFGDRQPFGGFDG